MRRFLNNHIVIKQSNTTEESNHTPYITNYDSSIIANFAPYQLPQWCLSSWKVPWRIPLEIIQFAFPFELWIYLKYFHKLVYQINYSRIASLAAPGHLLYSQHAQSLSCFTFELDQFLLVLLAFRLRSIKWPERARPCNQSKRGYFEPSSQFFNNKQNTCFEVVIKFTPGI